MESATYEHRDGRPLAIVEVLIGVGLKRGYSYPWHRTKDPFRLLVAEYLLRRTTRTVVARVYDALITRYPNASALAKATSEDLWDVARAAGLKQRTLRLVDIAQRVERDSDLLHSRHALLSLPYVGPYIADAVLLYALGERRFPIDGNVQRVLYRVLRGEDPPRGAEPYQNTTTDRMVGSLTRDLSARQLRHLHQGVMVVAWEACRSTPVCRACALRERCHYLMTPPNTSR